MRRVLYVIVLLLLLFSCKERPKRPPIRTKPIQTQVDVSNIGKKVVDKNKRNSQKDKGQIKSTVENENIIKIQEKESDNSLSPEEIFERNTSAVFKIHTSNGFTGGQGSGFFISSEGVAVSNYHVFQGTTIGYEEIILSNGLRYKVKEVYYKSKEEDFIIFKVDISGVNYIKISNASPRIGEKIYTIGSPQGYDNTFSSGEISQIRNNGKLIQISAPIDHGSSGGVLLNSKGEAIGITSSGVDTSIANLNFAINIDIVEPFLSSYIHSTSVEQANITSSNTQLREIKYLGFEVLYNVENKIPHWVKYELTASETDGPYSRKDKEFRVDMSAGVPQADDFDYKRSGWSRGHMAPAADFKWNNGAMWDTFYYTNCCPQNQSLNAGQWGTLEKKVRLWANKFGRVDVVTGPIVGQNVYGTIGRNNIVVPDAFFKAILSDEQAIAFVMFNHNANENLQKCAMSVDELEDITGYDFFSELEDDLEERVEQSYNKKYWGL